MFEVDVVDGLIVKLSVAVLSHPLALCTLKSINSTCSISYSIPRVSITFCNVEVDVVDGLIVKLSVAVESHPLALCT